MTELQIILAALAAATTAAYACRLGLLHPSRHRAGVILVHLLLSWVSVAALYSAVTGQHLVTLPALAVSALWILATLPEWRAGVPGDMRRPDAPPSVIHIDPLSR